ncbi:hypothetical protein LCGC14_0370560 [marine sediment metagenome]|uniref:Uncharacterized protein n=1 Tax=marine sediment metagenome TaxID=412755 RepID=A0A0F9T595_9ZZZZ|nr:hypothetical protein [Maribacter sp.]HDZ04890.1 hypothetical protein [Maribacter sp.]
MNTKEIQELLCKEEVLKGNLPCENVSNIFYCSESDVVSILKSGYTVEYEVKISRSDFKADAKKSKWKFYNAKVEKGIPNYFYYACPENLINKNEVPSFAGLIYVYENGCKIIKKASILHRYKHDLIKLLTKFCRVKSERKYLGSCLLTYKNNKIKERNTIFAFKTPAQYTPL